MAEGNGADSANKQHNVKEINKVIRECATEMTRIKAARQELNEQAGDIRERLRDAGVEVSSFNFALRVRDMEDEARANYIDWLRVSFEALGVGAQGMLFPEDGQPAAA